MESYVKAPIEKMLSDAYAALGVEDKKQQERYIKEAQDYLLKDREHYIEPANEDVPEYRITVNYGKICKLVTLAQRIERDSYAEYVRESKVVLSLMIGENARAYVYAYTYADLYDDPEKNQYGNPVYRYANLQELIKDLKVASAQDIRPVVTPFEWDCYCVIFTAFMKLCRSLVENAIPHKTELAMILLEHAKSETICLDGENINCKLLPLAHSVSGAETMHADHRYSFQEKLCLLIMGEQIGYALCVTHTYQYFTKIGGKNGYFRDTEQKQQTEYKCITWDEIPEDMQPLYY